MTTVAITGGTGFIGRHVLGELANRQVNVMATTRNAAKLEFRWDRLEVLELDIAGASADDLDHLASADVLIHLAWDGLPNYQSRHHIETELPKQYRFLKSLIERGLSAMVIAGTCAEYGLQSGELSEECSPLPANAYGLAKDSLRRQLELLARDHAFEMTWARLFYMYGDGQPATALYSQLKTAAERGDLTFDMSGGEQLRDYLPVTEVARLLSDLAVKCRGVGILNVCSGQPVTVRSLVEGWLSRNSWHLRLNLGRHPYPEYEPMAFWGDRRKLDHMCTQQ